MELRSMISAHRTLRTTTTATTAHAGCLRHSVCLTAPDVSADCPLSMRPHPAALNVRPDRRRLLTCVELGCIDGAESVQ